MKAKLNKEYLMRDFSQQKKPLSLLKSVLYRLLWFGVSVVGALAGSVLAVFLFPKVSAFGLCEWWQFKIACPPFESFWHYVEFTLAMSIPMAVLQGLVLLRIGVVKAQVLLLWIPITSIGIAVMMLPVYVTEMAEALLGYMYFVIPILFAVAMMVPGMVILALGQSVLMPFRKRSVRIRWGLMTIVGGILGSPMGLVWGFLLYGEGTEWALEPALLALIGAGIGLFQGLALPRNWGK